MKATKWAWPVGAFLFVAVLGYGAHAAIGRVYGMGQALDLLRSLSRSGLYLGSAAATASATTLALMLTLVGMVRNVDEQFDVGIYVSIRRIASLATASLVMSLLLLLVLVFPMEEFKDIPNSWYPTLYEVVFAATILVVALLSATVAMVYSTVRQVIAKITPSDT